MRAIVLGALALTCLPLGHAVASDKPGPKAAELIEKYADLNGECRGSTNPNSRQTQKACRKRNQVGDQLEKLGWCFGPSEPDMAAYQYQWMHCRNIRW